MSRKHAIMESPLGPLTLVADDGALAAVYFEAHRRLPDPSAFGPRSRHGFEAVTEQLGEYFAGERTSFELRVAPRGGEFQARVWALLSRIPYGETRRYGQLAAELGGPALARAVGAATGRNPLSIVVPCHRLVGAGGALVGYAGGLERKRALLTLESAVAARQLGVAAGA